MDVGVLLGGDLGVLGDAIAHLGEHVLELNDAVGHRVLRDLGVLKGADNAHRAEEAALLD